MIEFYQITGSTSFAVRCALEEIGVEYRAIDIEPFDRSQPASFAEVNPGAPCPRSATARPRSTRSARACCTWPSGFRRPGSRRPPAIPRAAPICAGWCGSPTRSGRSGSGSWRRSSSRRSASRGVRAKGVEELESVGENLEARASRAHWCLGEPVHRRRHLPLHAGRLAALQAGTADRGRGRAGALLRASARGPRSPGRAHSTTSTSGRSASIPELRGGKPVDAPKVTFDF